MFTLNCNGRLLAFDEPIVMGIVNTTPDSFYAGSRHLDVDEVLRVAERMIADGATILDIGGQSSRPGSATVGVEEELRRVVAPIAAIAKKFPGTIISIDTYHSRVAAEACAAGASIVNDISGGSIDPEMTRTVAALRVPYVLMHMQGRPETMQINPVYKDVTQEVLDFFIRQCKFLDDAGIRDVIIDPGFGFGKTIEHNFTLLRNIPVFRMLDRPLLLGVSRKSSISTILGVSIDQTLNGTTVLNTMGLMNGASILRVHDVKEAVEAVKLFRAYNGQ